MWKLRRSVCVWSQYDLERFKETNIRPSCSSHEHISRNEARELTNAYLREDLVRGDQVKNKKFKSVYECNWVPAKKPYSPWNKYTQERPIDGLEPYEAIYFTTPMGWGIKKSANFDVHQLIHLG